ncbi:proline racemase family protein [Sinomonas terrae]|uniref:Proline racemase family protein n=1 Tax=Sinomonas terrae TaxID=2908838 RepID=A0ABS9U6X4_9MICC|nr:proline racemase family protein [Sinomonas terrae]MCH6472439.1 proline racemase family protein [Sinomonas terrae]
MRWNKTITVVDCHAEGESGRVVVGGVPHIPGETVFDKRLYLQNRQDDLRRMILFEPRGAAHHNANVIVASNNPAAQMGYIILESMEYPAMSGSNTMCVATVLLETGILPMSEPTTELVLESPAGLIAVTCECKDGKVERVRFVNQPAFCYHLGKEVNVPGIGNLTVDIVYGGMTYVMVEAEQLGYALEPSEARILCEVGQTIKRAAAEQIDVVHPENPDIPGITQIEFTGPLRREGDSLRARNTVVVSPGRVDRSPCGTGTSARLAQLHAKGLIEPGETFIHESIIGTTFESSIVDTTHVGDYPAVIPAVAGQAWITGIYQMGMDPSDPFPRGFTLADTWLRQIDNLEPVRTAAE